MNKAFILFFVFFPLLANAQKGTIYIEVFQFHINFDDDYVGENEYRIKFWVNGKEPSNSAQLCQKICCYKGNHSPQYLYYWPDSTTSNTVNLRMEAWEDDEGNECMKNGGDDKPIDKNVHFDFVTEGRPQTHERSKHNFDNDWGVTFTYWWQPPQFKSITVTSGITSCGKKNNITLKTEDFPSWITDKTNEFGFNWQYDDVGNGFYKTLGTTNKNSITFPAPEYSKLTKVRYRVIPIVKGHTCYPRDAKTTNKDLILNYEYATATVDIYPPPPTDFQFKVNNILCKGAKNGSIEIGDVTGLYNSYYAVLRNVANDNTIDIANHPKTGVKNYFTGLDVGTYELKALNNISMNDELKQVCSISKFITITEPSTKVQFNNPAFSASNYNGYNISCFNGSNAEITLASSGGTGSHTYSLDNINYQASSIFSNLKAGNYTLYVKDQNGCLPDALPTATLAQPPVLRHVATVPEYYHSIHLKCYGDNSGKIELTIRGGVTPYRTSVNNSSFAQGKTTYDNLTAGDYNIKIYDNNNCLVESSRSLNPPPPLTFSEKSLIAPTCSGYVDGSISLNLNGGIVYSTKGYSATFTDPIGNISSRTGTTFQFNDLKKGSYTFRSTDDQGCIKDTTIIVNEPAPVTASISYTDIACKGGSTGYIYANASGGSNTFTYKVKESTGKELGEVTYPGKGIQINKLPKGNYTIDIVDSKGCKPKTPYTQKISEPELSLDLLQEQVSNVKCFGESNGEIKVKGAGGWSTYSYSIDGKSFATTPTFSNLKEGKYKLYVNDKLNCKDSLEVKVTQPERLVSAVNGIEDVKCFSGSDGSISLTTKGGTKPYRFSRNNGVSFQKDSLFKGLPKGSYTISIRDTNGCNQSVKATIAEPTDLIVSIVSATNAACNKPNGAASVQASGGTKGYKYSWSLDKAIKDSTIKNVYSGKYFAIAEDKNKCKDSIAVFINDEDGPKVVQGVTKSATCSYLSDGSASIVVNGGHPPYQYQWPSIVQNVDTIHATKLKGGNYLVEVTDIKDCKGSVLVKVPSPEELVLQFDSVVHPLCEKDCNGKIRVSGKGGSSFYSYSWKVNDVKATYRDSVVRNLCAGKYSIEVQDKNKCIYTDEVLLIDPLLTVGLEDSLVMCKGQVLTVDAGVDSMQYLWTSNNGFTSENRKIKIKEGGNYYLKVTDINGCEGKDTIRVVTSSKLLKARFLIPGKAIASDTINLIEYSWPAPETVEWTYPKEFKYIKDDRDWKLLEVTEPGTYIVKLTVTLGECRDELEKEIIVLEPIYKDSLNSGRLGFSGIENVLLFPNPNYGAFAVDVKLTEAMDIEIQVNNVFMGEPIAKMKQSGKESYSLDLNLLNLASGAYYLTVRTANDYKVVKFLIH